MYGIDSIAGLARQEHRFPEKPWRAKTFPVHGDLTTQQSAGALLTHLAAHRRCDEADCITGAILATVANRECTAKLTEKWHYLDAVAVVLSRWQADIIGGLN